MGFDILGAASSAIGSIGQAVLGNYNSNMQRSYNSYMSNTSHQRETKDLIAAGLNPMLSANAGANVPSYSVPQTADSIGDSVSSGWSAAINREQVKNLQLQGDVLDQQAKQEQIKTGVADATFNEQVKSIRSAAKLADINAYVNDLTKDSQVDQARANASASQLALPELRATAGLYDSSAGTFTKVLQTYLPFLGNLSNSAGAIKNLFSKSAPVSKFPIPRR